MEIGMILMGHGHFASGMYSTLTLIGGPQEALTWIDFTEEKDMDGLLQELQQKVKEMRAYDHLLILCDLDGGTPYKAALLYAMEHRNVEILSGISFPLLLECSLTRAYAKDMDVLLEATVESGRMNMKRFDRTLMNM